MKDYEITAQSTISLACRYYRVLICTENAFPNALDRERYAHECWELACQDLKHTLIATPDVYNVVCLSIDVALQIKW